MSRLDFLYRTELPHRAVAVYIYLADRTNENNECWPAIPTIAADLKYSPATAARFSADIGFLSWQASILLKSARNLSLLSRLRVMRFFSPAARCKKGESR